MLVVHFYPFEVLMSARICILDAEDISEVMEPTFLKEQRSRSKLYSSAGTFISESAYTVAQMLKSDYFRAKRGTIFLKESYLVQVLLCNLYTVQCTTI